MLLIVVVTSVGYLFRYEVSGTDTYLFNGDPIPSNLLPAMQSAFNKAGLETPDTEGGRIRVPHGQQGAYMGALVDAKALPPNFGSSFAAPSTPPIPLKPNKPTKSASVSPPRKTWACGFAPCRELRTPT